MILFWISKSSFVFHWSINELCYVFDKFLAAICDAISPFPNMMQVRATCSLWRLGPVWLGLYRWSAGEEMPLLWEECLESQWRAAAYLGNTGYPGGSWECEEIIQRNMLYSQIIMYSEWLQSWSAMSHEKQFPLFSQPWVLQTCDWGQCSIALGAEPEVLRCSADQSMLHPTFVFNAMENSQIFSNQVWLVVGRTNFAAACWYFHCVCDFHLFPSLSWGKHPVPSLWGVATWHMM